MQRERKRESGIEKKSDPMMNPKPKPKKAKKQPKNRPNAHATQMTQNIDITHNT